MRRHRRRRRRRRSARRGPADRADARDRGRPRAAGAHGIKPGDVRRAAATLVQGIEVGSLFEEQKVFDVIVVGVPEVRASVTSIRDLLVDSPTAARCGSGRWPTCASRRLRSSIGREATSRRIDVAADVGGRDLDAVLDDVERRLQAGRVPARVPRRGARRSPPSGRRPGGASSAVGVAAVIGIFLLLQAAFGSWRLAAALLPGLPLRSPAASSRRSSSAARSRWGAPGPLRGVRLAVRSGVAPDRPLPAARRAGRKGVDRGLVLRGAEERLRRRSRRRWRPASPPPAGRARQRPGLRDRAAAGRRRPRRPGHLDAFTLFVVPALYLRLGAGDAPERRRACEAQRRGPGVD